MDFPGTTYALSYGHRFAGIITRPANMTAYSAGQVIGDVSGSAILRLGNIGPPGGFIQLQSVRLLVHTATAIASSFRLHFYNMQPTAIANGAAWDLVANDRAGYLDYIDLPTPTDLGSTLFSKVDWPGSMLKLAPGDGSLFCILQALAGFTPTENSTVYDVRVNAMEAGR